MVSFTRKETVEEEQIRRGDEQLDLGHGEFEVPEKHPCGKARQQVIKHYQ